MYPPKLYKGVVWQDNHKLMYLGMQDQFHTFNMFDCQAWYARDVIMNKINIPSDAVCAETRSEDVVPELETERTMEKLVEKDMTFAYDNPQGASA